MRKHDSGRKKPDSSHRGHPAERPGVGHPPDATTHQGGQGQGQGRGANPGQEKREEPTQPTDKDKRQDPATPKTDDPYKVAKGHDGKAKEARSRLADVGEAAGQKE